MPAAANIYLLSVGLCLPLVNCQHLRVFTLQNLKLVENVKKLAAKKNVTAGQMALAWLQHQVPRKLLVMFLFKQC